ncbi:MAG: hypothetical protein RL308_1934 [Bacteroidota bacterium]|jgi:hypothetical protein
MKKVNFKSFTIIIAITTILGCASSENAPSNTAPSVTTTTISNVTLNLASSGGNVTSNGGDAVTARGIVWNTATSPTISLTTKTNDGTGTGNFSSSITNLIPSSTYFVRAYATNSVGTAYGNELSFTTGAIVLPTVSTTAITGITTNAAVSGGNITSDGGGPITARGIVWNTSQNPTIALTTKTTDGTGVGSFVSNMATLVQNTTYYVRAYATNSIGTAYGNELSFTTVAIVLPTLSTTVISGITYNSAVSGGSITSNGGGTILARGVVWSKISNPTIALSTKTTDGSGTGVFTSSISGLSPNTSYFVKSYATNSAGTVYGNQVNFTTQNINYSTLYPSGTVFCNNVVTAVVDVTNPVTGKTWMDRNLGASQVATSSTDSSAYGDLYQWGRRADGHQCRNSSTSTIISSSDLPNNGNFIVTLQDPNWHSPQNNNLWQGISGKNNPCPSGYRLPTETELNAERLSWSSNNMIGAFASPLKFTVAGKRGVGDGSLSNVGTIGSYWSSTVGNPYSRLLDFYVNGATTISNNLRVFGFTVRCIKN